MAAPQELYLLSVSAGHVLSQGAAELVARNPDSNDKTQRWTVEPGDGEGIFALKNVGTGKYMIAKGGHASALTNTGEKQWWKWSTEDVQAPGAMRLSPKDYPQAYLNHYQGIRVPPGHPGIKVHMWPWDTNLQQWLTWWLMDANGALVSPKQAASPTSNGQITSPNGTSVETPKKGGGLPSADKQIHVTTVCYGQVLTMGKKGFMVSAQPEAGNKSQRWTVEQGEGNLIALKNADTGKYMCAEKDSGWGKIYNNGELTWWKWGTDGCGTAGSVWLQPQQYSKSWLNVHNGEYRRVGQEGVEVHMWGWSKGHDEQFSWRFLDADRDMSGSPQAALSSGAGSVGSGVDTKDLEAREAALAAEKKELEAVRSQVTIDKKFLASNQKSYNDESTALKKQQEAMQAKQKELTDKENSLAADSNKQADEMKQKLDELQRREAALAEKEKNQAAESSEDGKDAAEKAKAALDDVQVRENALAKKEKEAADDREAALKKMQERENAVQEKEIKLQDVEKREAAVAENERKNQSLGDADRQAAELQKQHRDVAEQLRKLAEKERTLAAREKELAAKQSAAVEAASAQPSCNCAAKEQDLVKRERGLESRDKALAAKERRFAASQGTGDKGPASTNGNTPATKPSSKKPSVGEGDDAQTAKPAGKPAKSPSSGQDLRPATKDIKTVTKDIKPTTKDYKKSSLAQESKPTTKNDKANGKDGKPASTHDVKPTTKDIKRKVNKPAPIQDVKPTAKDGKPTTKDDQPLSGKDQPAKANTTKQRRPANGTEAGKSADDERLKQLQDRLDKMEKMLANGSTPSDAHSDHASHAVPGRRTTHRHCKLGPRKLDCRCGWTPEVQ